MQLLDGAAAQKEHLSSILRGLQVSGYRCCNVGPEVAELLASGATPSQTVLVRLAQLDWQVGFQLKLDQRRHSNLDQRHQLPAVVC